MSKNWSPLDHSNGQGGSRRVEFDGIDNGASVGRMYVARSRACGPPSTIRRVKSKQSSSSTSMISSLKAWFNDPEKKRKKKNAKYKVHTYEGDERSDCGNDKMRSRKVIPDSPTAAIATSTSYSSSPMVAPQSSHHTSPSSTPSQNPNLVKCFHDLHASLQSCNEPPKVGKRYFGCPMQKSEMCDFCVWVEDQSEDQGNRKSENSSRASDDEKHREIRQLAEEVRMLKEIVEKLSLENSNMEQEERKVKEDIGKIKMKLFDNANKENLALKALLLTWFCIAVGVGVLAMRVHGLMNNDR